MNNSNRNNVFLLTTSIAVVCSSILLYTYRNDIFDTYMGMTEGEEMIRLINISTAIKKLNENLIDLEVILEEPGVTVASLTPTDKKKLIILLADVDYIYEQLDMITGNQIIKTKRKECIVSMKKFTEKTDILAKQLSN